MTSHVINFNKPNWFSIITYLKVDLSLITYYLTYLTFLINLINQISKPSFLINLYWIGGTTNL